MDAAEERQISDGALSPVRVANYFEDAYDAMELNFTDPMQELGNNDDVSDDTTTSHRQPEVDVSISPLPETLEVNNDDEAIQSHRVKPGVPQVPSCKQEEYLIDQGPNVITTSGSVPEKLESTHTAQDYLKEQTLELQAELSKSSETRPMGVVRFRDGGMEYRESWDEHWFPAEYHYNLRTMFVIADSERGDKYDFPDPQGKDAYDITTFHPDSKNWGPNWQNRPPILKRFSRNGYPVPAYKPEVMTDNGRVVIDQQNHAVLDWIELPLCISSKVPGYKMEAWRRLNPNISTSDILARMPKTDKSFVQERNKLSMRMTRSRLKGACISWIAREGCQAIRDYMANLIGPACVAANSIEAFGRDLTEAEVAAATAANKGKFPARAHRKPKRESQELDAGSTQQPVKLESDQEGDEVVDLTKDDEQPQAQISRPYERPISPLVRSASPLIEARQANAYAPEVIVQRRYPQSEGDVRTATQTRPRSVTPGILVQRQHQYHVGGNSRARMQIQHRPIVRRNAISSANPMVPDISRFHDQYRRRESIGYRRLTDPSHEMPRNRAEVASIQRALRFAREDFMLHYSEEPPLTDNRQSYWMQLQELRIAFVQRWFFAGPPPELTRITDWGESVMEWRPPRLDRRHSSFRHY